MCVVGSRGGGEGGDLERVVVGGARLGLSISWGTTANAAADVITFQ